jgi:sterol desaturase/sphingolipid hydroxylase (fatty acid hydroxylase superfamily)
VELPDPFAAADRSRPEHYDSNFAALFPIWDVLFRSYYRPDGFPPTGLDQRPQNLRELFAWPFYYRRS